MTLVSKKIGKENGSDEEAKESEEGFLLNSDDEVVAYYFNNRVKKFYKSQSAETWKTLMWES